MSEIYHDPPSILTTLGSICQEHYFHLAADSASIDVVLESRVGLFGELVRRCYCVEPPLPEELRRNPDAFLETLACNLKIRNFEKKQDLWIYRLEFRRDDLKLPPVIRKETIPMWEKMIHGLTKSNSIMFDLAPGPRPIEAAEFYETR